MAFALKRMYKDGIEEVIVQPSHIINGVENDNMLSAVRESGSLFKKIICSAPLLTSENDYSDVADAIHDIINSWEIEAADENSIINSKENAVLLMGHGSNHHANSAYAALEYRLRDHGMENIFIANVEAYPYIDNVIEKLEQKKYKKVILAPFMIVAGGHVKNDMAGDDDDSWKNLLVKKGFEVHCILKGLGEYKSIREIFIKHARESVQDL